MCKPVGNFDIIKFGYTCPIPSKLFSRLQSAGGGCQPICSANKLSEKYQKFDFKVAIKKWVKNTNVNNA